MSTLYAVVELCATPDCRVSALVMVEASPHDDIASITEKAASKAAEEKLDALPEPRAVYITRTLRQACMVAGYAVPECHSPRKIIPSNEDNT